MKIVVLDGHTINPGDLSWDEMKQLGDLTVYERTSTTEVVSRAQGSTAVFTNKTPVTREMIGLLPDLKFIGVLATGYNIVDIDAASQKGIIVCNVPGYGTASVVQLTFALILEHFNQVYIHAKSVRDGEWVSSKDFTYSKTPLTELSNKTIGIIGFGSIGQEVADVAAAFNMNTLAYSRTKTDQSHRKNFNWVELKELYQSSDVISIHCPLTEQTKGMINKDALRMMKKSAFLVNTARGPIIVEDDLAEALNNGTIGGAGLDVLSKEPPVNDNPLLTAKNAIITPHIAWATKEARSRLMEITVANLRSYQSGDPVNQVN